MVIEAPPALRLLVTSLVRIMHTARLVILNDSARWP